jgi:hypothetical protein
MLLLRGELRRELASDLSEAEERELRLAAGGVGEGMELVELIFAVQRLQRRRRIPLGHRNGDVQLRGALRDRDDVHVCAAECGERAGRDTGTSAHAEADDGDECDGFLRADTVDQLRLALEQERLLQRLRRTHGFSPARRSRCSTRSRPG